MKVLGLVAYLGMEDFKDLVFGRVLPLPYGVNEIRLNPNVVVQVMKQAVDDLDKYLEEEKNEEEAKT
jgi:hypothetical protein